MRWGEALRLTAILATDTSSHVAAALNGWERPASMHELALLDLYDLTHMAAWSQGGGKGKRPKPYPRPWPDRSKTVMTPTVTQEQVIEALRFAGHTMPLPA